MVIPRSSRFSHRGWTPGLCAAALAIGAAAAAGPPVARQNQLPDRQPARFLEGGLPEPPLLAAEGGLALFLLNLSASGEVTEVMTMGDAPPFTELVEPRLQAWRFRPAHQASKPVPSRVLVAALFRAPELVDPRPERAPPPLREASPRDVPIPTAIETPPFPPLAVSDGIVLVEVEVDASGLVEGVAIVRSGPGFDAASLEAAKNWRFTPARKDGQTIGSVAYLVFGFRQPVTDGLPTRKKPPPDDFP